MVINGLQKENCIPHIRRFLKKYHILAVYGFLVTKSKMSFIPPTHIYGGERTREFLRIFSMVRVPLKDTLQTQNRTHIAVSSLN